VNPDTLSVPIALAGRPDVAPLAPPTFFVDEILHATCREGIHHLRLGAFVQTEDNDVPTVLPTLDVRLTKEAVSKLVASVRSIFPRAREPEFDGNTPFYKAPKPSFGLRQDVGFRSRVRVPLIFVDSLGTTSLYQNVYYLQLNSTFVLSNNERVSRPALHLRLTRAATRRLIAALDATS